MRVHIPRTQALLSLALLALCASAASAASPTDRIYWTREIGDVRVGSLVGDGAGAPSTVFADGGGPCGVAIDPRPAPVGQKIYWANFSTNTIRRSNLDGTSAEDVVVGQDHPCGVALDPSANRIYWVNFCGVPSSACPPAGTTGSCGCGTVMGASLAGALPVTPDQPALFAGEDGPSGVAIDPAASQIYWTNQFPGTTKGTVRVGSLSGGGSASTLFGDQPNPWGLAIDSTAAKVYWSNLGPVCCSGPGSVRVGNLDGSGVPIDLFGGVSDPIELGPAGVAIDPTDTPPTLYWATFGGGQIRSGPLGGSSVGPASTLFSGEGLANQPALSRCGDGLVIGSEQCDDGGKADGDGCSAECIIEDGASCSGAPSVCTPLGCAATGAEGSACNDGNACTQTDTCHAGSCVGSNPVTCTASDTCHVAGACDPVTGVCSSSAAPDGTCCDDGNACTTLDTCCAGHCNGGAPLDCSDGKACTDDLCDPAAGCKNPNKACAELPCRQAGVCSPSTGACTYQLKPERSLCSDGNACTSGDACYAGTCTGTVKSCAPPDACHSAASCDPSSGACVYPLKANGSTCSDANSCTTGDACADGTCRGVAKNCDDQNLCTTDSCSPSSGCRYAYNTSTCDDGNACTTSDRCSYGTCRGGAAPSCNDNNPCTTDACDRSSGCTNAPNTATCSDGNPCTRNDRCSAGTCLGGSPPSCDDGNPCTIDVCTSTGCKNTPVVCQPSDSCHSAGTCNQATGACSNPVKAEGSACNDGNPCTQGEACHAGTCGGGLPPSCPQCTVEADTMVRQFYPYQNYNLSTELEAVSSPGSQTLFRVRVTGSGGVGAAKLRLTTKRDATLSGGRLHQVPCTWQAGYVNWSNKPALGPTLDTKDALAANQQLEFDLSSVITTAGPYCFAIDNPGGSAVYVSLESATPSIRPIVLLQSACACAP